jgi:riboflavin kinase / FMN adenylyltransferase
MMILTWEELLQKRLATGQKVMVSVGVFDGLHLGHRRLLSEITGGAHDTIGVVVTFSRSPVVVRAPEDFPGAILTLRQKLERMGSLGVRAAVVIDFSDEMSNLSGEAFVRLLSETLTIQKIVVGQNFRFGKKRISGTDDLKEMLSETGIELLVTAPVLRGSSMVSSSRIRTAIRAGELKEAREMLTVPHTIDLRDVPGRAGPGGLQRFPRAEIHQVLPPAGDYEVLCDGPGSLRPATCRIEEDWLALSAENGAGVRSLQLTRRKE